MNLLQSVLSLDLEDEAIKGIAAELSKVTVNDAFLRLTCAKLLSKTLAVGHESKRVLQKGPPLTYVSHLRDYIAELPYMPRG